MARVAGRGKRDTLDSLRSNEEACVRVRVRVPVLLVEERRTRSARWRWNGQIGSPSE